MDGNALWEFKFKGYITIVLIHHLTNNLIQHQYLNI